MRHPIEKSPRDGTAIIVEDDASGTSDIAHWSTEAGQWLGENSEPTRIKPTLGFHWRAINIFGEKTKDRAINHGAAVHGDLHSPRCVSALRVAAYVTRYAGHEEGSRKSNLVAQQHDQAVAPVEAQRLLAETYDPAILFGTYGTRGEAAKAREHYPKAHAGGLGRRRTDSTHWASERSRLQFMLR
jgi:hypothetical protein